MLAILDALDLARAELRAELLRMLSTGEDDALRFTAQHLRVTLAAVESAVRAMTQRMGRALDTSVVQQGELALETLMDTIRANDPEFLGTAGSTLEIKALARITERNGLLLHRHSVERYGLETIDNVQRRLAVGLGRNQRLGDIVDSVAGVIDAGRPRAELISRMELNSAFNANHQASVEEASDVLDDPDEPDPLLKRIDEFFDARNHPFSRAADEVVARPREPFRVSAAKVAEHAAAMGKRVGGITWPLVGGFYEGMHHPAHFWDRGRQTAWRASWAT